MAWLPKSAQGSYGKVPVGGHSHASRGHATPIGDNPLVTMETEAHLQLKRLAAAYLLREGFAAVASEVAGPLMRVRVDVAGYIDRLPHGPGVNHLTYTTESQPGLPYEPTGPRARCDPRIVVIECKQERADLLRDVDDLAHLLDLRERIAARRTALEETILERGDPGLRLIQGGLFEGIVGGVVADFSRVQSHEYRRLMARIGKVEERIHGQTKFFRLARYAAADRLYVLTFRAMAQPRELPAGWGLLECDARPGDLRKMTLTELSEIPIRERHSAPEHPTNSAWKQRWLRSIAAASTRTWVRGR